MTGATTYFTDGGAYDRLMAAPSRAVGEKFLDWLAVSPGLRWLDAGCGTGVFTELALERCAPQSVTAIDPAEDQIAHARTKPLAKKVNLQIGDAQSLPFGNGEFDVATMALVITFVPDPPKAVAEMKRVVKPGGTLGTYMWDMLGGGPPQQKLREAAEAMGVTVPSLPGHANSTMEKLNSFFAGAGLDAVSACSIEIEVSYPNFDAYWSSQTALSNYIVAQIRKMSDRDVDRLRDDLRRHLPTDQSGRITIKARANAVKGRVPK
jgi:ubiquinone/menaquinone biosynthesis C-methylase UbiE